VTFSDPRRLGRLLPHFRPPLPAVAPATSSAGGDGMIGRPRAHHYGGYHKKRSPQRARSRWSTNTAASSATGTSYMHLLNPPA